MPLVARSTIEEIRNRVSLLDVVAPYTQMRRAGSQWRGLSPFNEEKSPSFFIHPEKNVFKCYSSGHAGDIFRFLQIKENLNFQEAIEVLAERFHIPLHYEAGDSAAGAQDLSIRKELLLIHEIATDYYAKQFMANNTLSETIRKYWTEQRRFSMELAEAFKIGFAPPADRELIELLMRKRFSLKAIQQCGLFYLREHERDMRAMKPRFRGRLMIPIRDVQGRVIAFTARVLPCTPAEDPTREAKYVNSPETPIFTKSHVLFGLDHARLAIQQTGHFVMVEGQLDTLRAWDVGLKTAVAPQGTSVTAQQLAMLRRYTMNVDVLLDGDSAGQKAAMRLLPMAIQAGIELRFLMLPPQEDPDSFFLQHGQAGYTKLLETAQDSMQFAIRVLAPEGGMSTASVKEQVFRQIAQFFEGVDTLASAHTQLRKAGQLLGLYEYTVDSYINKLAAHTPLPTPPKPATLQGNSSKLTTAEYQLLVLVLHHPDLAKKIAYLIEPEWIATDSTPGILLNRILAHIREGDIWDEKNNFEDILEHDEERDCIYGILARSSPFEEDPLKAANQCIKAVFIDFYDKQKAQLASALSQAHPEDHVRQQALQRERIEIRKKQSSPPAL
ncbi:MAG: DNA primase [Verrucomicrobia bacterium 21-51-4]|nr:MAG: DNA primase [Verrucomicrobia bacterium 21-51-4]HQU08443.1 DNA primase [Opitutales bacterium]